MAVAASMVAALLAARAWKRCLGAGALGSRATNLGAATAWNVAAVGRRRALACAAIRTTKLERREMFMPRSGRALACGCSLNRMQTMC